jgi:predicted metalloprotease
MFKFLFVIFFFIILMTLMLGLSFLRTLKRVLFGESESEKKARQQRQATQHTSRQKSANRQEAASSKKKVFNKNEGEYVDYEEIKE